VFYRYGRVNSANAGCSNDLINYIAMSNIFRNVFVIFSFLLFDNCNYYNIHIFTIFPIDKSMG